MAIADRALGPYLTNADDIIESMREGVHDMFISDNIPTERS